MGVDNIKILLAIAKLNFSRDIVYRLDFLFRVLESVMSIIISLIIYLILYTNTSGIPGWSINQILILIGTFELVRSVMFFFFIKNLPAIDTLVRHGNLDVFLLLPINTQFFISFTRWSITSIFDIILSLTIIALGVYRENISISFYEIAVFILLIFVSIVINYSIWFSCMCLAFWINKVSSLQEGYLNLFEFSRYPGSIYPKFISHLLTFIVPLILSVSVPASSLWNINSLQIILLVSLAFIWFIVSRILFKYGLENYSSANG